MTKAVKTRDDVSGEHRLPRGVLGVAAALVTLGGLTQAVGAVIEGPRWPSILGVIVWPLWLFYFTYVFRSRTLVTPHGLEVLNGWRWRKMAWEQVASFSKTTGGLVRPAVVTVRTVDGTTVDTHVPHRMRPELDRYRRMHGRHGH